ncbi:MAG TPA: PaaI family thioesterase [Rhizomicrobium sp.]|jgi:acyl-coenzyme A thioesterase PaaI-like protein|nr:PaaI family thioesterase [Rhizomicrobium sp.]
MSANIPAGFAPLKMTMGFLETNGPLYGKWEKERLHLGFRVEARHCNPGMVAHGGMMATFADMQLPLAARFQSKLDPGFSPTVNLTCDFVAPAPLGAWVEGSAEMTHATRNLLFVHGTATADGKICLRANGIFRIVRMPNEAFSLENLFGTVAGRQG